VCKLQDFPEFYEKLLISDSHLVHVMAAASGNRLGPNDKNTVISDKYGRIALSLQCSAIIDLGNIFIIRPHFEHTDVESKVTI